MPQEHDNSLPFNRCNPIKSRLKTDKHKAKEPSEMCRTKTTEWEMTANMAAVVMCLEHSTERETWWLQMLIGILQTFFFKLCQFLLYNILSKIKLFLCKSVAPTFSKIPPFFLKAFFLFTASSRRRIAGFPIPIFSRSSLLTYSKWANLDKNETNCGHIKMVTDNITAIYFTNGTISTTSKYTK